MQIQLNDPNQFTLENVRKLIASGDDSTHTQLRVTKNGIAYLSDIVGAEDIDGLAFRLETLLAGSDDVGQNAAKDDHWVKKIFECLQSNWPKPTSSYIDRF